MRLSDFDERIFRNALGHFATGVTVVTSRTDRGEPLGLTVSSFNAVSLTPPLVLFSIGNEAAGFAAWKNASRYIVNILSAQQRDLSNRFGRPSLDKWKDLDAEGVDGGFIFHDALLALECESYRRYEGGDHEIVLGRVIAIHDLRPEDPHPLIFYRGRYNRIERSSTSAPLQDALFW
jgi:flavin reductase (DIM6/NTAB) family NADH-FMN oxidoreductase RutF